MLGLIYISKCLQPFNDESLRELLLQASTNNARLGVSGYLFYGQGFFLQYIEGEASAAHDIYASISHDSRHRILCMNEREPTDGRTFSDWSMHWLTQDEIPGKKNDFWLAPILRDYLIQNNTQTSIDPLWEDWAWEQLEMIAALYRENYK